MFGDEDGGGKKKKCNGAGEVTAEPRFKRVEFSKEIEFMQDDSLVT